MSGELSLIEELKALLGTSHPSVRTGIGDDCAVLEMDGATLLLTIDAFVEDVHFQRRFAPPRVLGARAAAAALSDIAAMGGEATALLVTAALGPEWTTADAKELALGIRERAAAAGAVVVGGDTTGSPGGTFLDIAVVGRIAPGDRAVHRSGGRPGDLLAVTGTVGASAVGLRHLLGELELSEAEAAWAVERHLAPTPRLSEGRLLASSPAVHAMIDLSDGLGRDVGHLARAADLQVEIDPALLPCSPALEGLRTRARKDWLDATLGGGEDYELAVALEPGSFDVLATQLEDATGTSISVIGRFSPPGVEDSRVRLSDGTLVDHLGFEHLT